MSVVAFILQKYDIFAYMELLSFPNPPASFEMAVVRYVEGYLESIKQYFPERNLMGFSEKRMEEHIGVVYAISHLLSHENWYLEHGGDGAPELFENAKRSKFSISISHCSSAQDETLVAVCISETTRKIGVDIVLMGDERIRRVAPRTMSERERVGGQLEKVWAVKESMFKAFGLGLDFKNDLAVVFDETEVCGTVRGEKSRWWVEEIGGVIVALGPT